MRPNKKLFLVASAVCAFVALALSPITAQTAPVVVHQHCNFQGWSVSLEEGAYTLAALRARGFVNDDASSIHIADGYAADIYQHDHYQGTILTKEEDDSCFVNESFNDIASSLVVRRLSSSSSSSTSSNSSSTSSSSSSSATRWQPTPATSWQWQLTGELNLDYDVDAYDLDLFDTPASVIADLQRAGKKVICYFSAGSYEDWRQDANQFASGDLGNTLDGWPGERWLDIRSSNVRAIMAQRLELARNKGCDAVEPDNVDGYTNNPGFPLTAQHQIDYNRYLAQEAHARGLSIGLKNAVELVDELVDDFDFAVNEQCFQYNECDTLYPFTAQNKAVFNAEYDDHLVSDANARAALCQDAQTRQFSTLILPLNLDDSFRYSCQEAAAPTLVTHNFSGTSAVFPNPERGWIVHRFSHAMGNLSVLRTSPEQVSLVLIKIDIGAFKNSDHLSTAKLNEIRAALQLCRDHGVKAVLRSAYSFVEQLAPDPASLTRMANHVMDMQPIYYDYRDVILAVEMGMFGPWGEMHSSSHSTQTHALYYPVKTDALQTIHNAYMVALPSDRQLLIRRPYYMREIFGDAGPLSAAEAYSGTPKARTGYHNDAFLYSADDGGTFAHGWSRQQELDYIHAMTRFTFFGGETFGTPNGQFNNAHNALQEARYQHMSYLNRDYYTPIYDAWGTTKQTFIRNLGYRLVLDTAAYSAKVKPGGFLQLSFTVRNEGFAAMHNPREVLLVIENGDTKLSAVTSIDPRAWRAGNMPVNETRSFHLPVNLQEGEWQVYLALPDPSPVLANDPRFAVRFANNSVWDARGLNRIGSFEVSQNAPGDIRQDSQFYEDGDGQIPDPTPTSSARIENNTLMLQTTYTAGLTYRQVYIDSDNNAATGFVTAGIGAEFLIENSGVYQHTGGGWSWQNVGTSAPVIDNHIYQWSIPLSIFAGSVTSGGAVIFSETNGGDITITSGSAVIQ